MNGTQLLNEMLPKEMVQRISPIGTPKHGSNERLVWCITGSKKIRAKDMYKLMADHIDQQPTQSFNWVWTIPVISRANLFGRKMVWHRLP